MSNKDIDDYQKDLGKNLYEQVLNENYTNVEIVCQNGKTFGHAAVLHRANRLWKILLTTVQDDNFTILLPNETVKNVQQWLKRVYIGATLANDTKNPAAYITYKKKDFEKRCDSCDKVFNSHKTFLSHMWTQHQSENWKIQCLDCPLKFPTKRHLLIHQSKIHGNQIKCSLCVKMFSSDANVREHIKNVHNSSKKYFCEHCGKKFSAKPYLKAHLKQHMEPRDMKKCPICDKEVTSRHLSQHVRSHDSTTWKNQCSICSEKFLTLYKLYEHESIVHTGKPRFKCKLCHKMFHTTARRAGHKKTCPGPTILPENAEIRSKFEK